MVHAVGVPEEFHRELGELAVYELLGSETAAAGLVFAVADDPAEGGAPIYHSGS
jgi:hypothetical protein